MRLQELRANDAMSAVPAITELIMVFMLSSGDGNQSYALTVKLLRAEIEPTASFMVIEPATAWSI